MHDAEERRYVRREVSNGVHIAVRRQAAGWGCGGV